jgi:hypothetical protein
LHTPPACEITAGCSHPTARALRLEEAMAPVATTCTTRADRTELTSRGTRSQLSCRFGGLPHRGPHVGSTSLSAASVDACDSISDIGEGAQYQQTTPTLYLIKLPGSGMRLFRCTCRFRSTLKIGERIAKVLGWEVPGKAEVTVNEEARAAARRGRIPCMPRCRGQCVPKVAVPLQVHRSRSSRSTSAPGGRGLRVRSAALANLLADLDRSARVCMRLCNPGCGPVCG